jgi:hypothetical protein
MWTRDARLPFVLCLALGALLAGCTVEGGRDDAGGGGGDEDVRLRPDVPTRPGEIRIEPADAERTATGADPVVIEYRALQTLTDGSERDVTAEAVWSSTVPLGTFAGNVFTSVTDRGGLTTIRATTEGGSGTTTLLLRRDSVFVTPGTPEDAPTRFGGTPVAGAAPELVYPEDGTIVPPNLGELEFHYRTNGSTLFELSIGTRAGAVRIYFGCPEAAGGGCIYTPDRDVWEAISGASAGAGPITYRLRGIDASGRLGETAERTLTVTTEPITGGLYYWNAAGTIDRFEFGVRGARAERFLGVAETGGGVCVGCHTLSRDGRRIAVGTGIPTTTFQVFDVASRTRLFGLGMGAMGFPSQPNFSAFNPDASELVTSGGMGLVLRSLGDGRPLSTITNYPSSMPDWSPDGNHIVHVEHRGPELGASVNADGVIRTVDWNGSAWVPGAVLVVGGGNNYYPAYAPDGAWIVFNRSPSNSASFASSGDGGTIAGDGQLWAVASTGGEPIRLDRADFSSDSWPKFDPTIYVDRGRNLYWFAWSSQRGFGLRYGDGNRWQLWMSAFDPAAAASGADASSPAFRLPFQDLATGNHIAQWVTSVERQTCTTDAECGGEFCVDGRCFAEAPLM